MIKGKQICPANDIGRKLQEKATEIQELEAKLRSAGLHEDANKLYDLANSVRSAGFALEYKARDAFFAARRGEELPQ